MKLKIILAVLVLFSSQMVYGIADAQSYNKSNKNVSGSKSRGVAFGTSGSTRVGAPINLKNYSSNTRSSRTSSYSAARESRKAVYGSKNQNADKYRTSMSASQASKTRDNYARQETKRREQRDEASAQRLAKAREAATIKDNTVETRLREVSLREERAEEKEQEVKKKKKRIYKKPKDQYQMPERVFNFN